MEGLSRIADANRDLFGSGKPRLETVHQGKLGNCYCLAPLGALLQASPKRVHTMFRPQIDGQCEVIFGSRVVMIAAVTDAELAQTAGNERDGLWVNVYEKAVGAARNADKPESERLSSPIDAMARGGSAGTMLAYITGHKIQRFSCSFAKDDRLTIADRDRILNELRDYLRTGFAAVRPFTCGTEKTATPGLTPNHAYALLGYDSDRDRLKVWNPHGQTFTPKGEPGLKHGYRCEDGVFEIPLTDFVQQFAGIAVETDVPVDGETELPKLPRTIRVGTQTHP